MHVAEIEATFEPSTARAVEESLALEAADLVDDRSQSRVSAADGVLSIVIEATDLVALRAACNTWTGLLEVAEATAKTIDHRF